MGWSPALETSGDKWPAPFLACLLTDPYDAVRIIARRSLRKQPGFHDFEYDFLGRESERVEARERAWKLWLDRPLGDRQYGRELLIDPATGIQRDAIKRLLDQRDDRPVHLLE